MANILKKIKIAYLLTPIDFGGAEKVSVNFLKNVEREKLYINPIVLIRPWENNNLFVDEIERENYRYFKIPVAIKPLSEGRDQFRLIRCFGILYSLLRKGHYNLVHTNGYFADIIGIPAAKLLGIPVVSTCHGFIATDKKLAIYNLLDRFVLRFSNKIIAVSEAMKSNLINGGIRGARIKAIQNAVKAENDTAKINKIRKRKRNVLNFDQRDFVIGYSGRLSQEKGIQYLIQTAQIMNEWDIPIKVLIIGKGPLEDELKNVVKDSGIEDKISFTGFQRDIENWMPAMDLFVLPSLTEGTPMALLEAMAFGIPVVASAVGGVPGVIESGENGILVRPGKPQEIANAVVKIYRDKGFRCKISKKAIETINNKFSIKNWVKEIEAVYSEIVYNQKI